ncbi:MAG TPA: magnesium transporter [Thermoanaerobaculia bacterium]|nr:magnesium transporter [Thermoanaerobaculia bacterium]
MSESGTLDRHTSRLTAAVRRLYRRGAKRHLTRLLAKTRPEDLAAVLDNLTPAEQLGVFQVAIRDFQEVAGQVLVAMDPASMHGLLSQLEPAEIARALDPLPVDDAVLVVEALPEETKEQVLELVDLEGSEELQTQLTYGEDTAGRIMTTEFFALPESTTVGQAVEKIREAGEVEMIFYLYVTNEEGELAGVLSLRQLLLTPPQKTLGDVANRSLIKVTVGTDQEEVARLASRYDLLAIPVIDELDRLVGIVTVDDVIDIVQEEADEDFLKMVGTTDDELLHREKSWRVARIRLPWILVNLVGLLATGLLFKHFELTLAEAIFLVFFAPLIMGMSGNVGSQTATIAVRGLATGRLGGGIAASWGFVGQQVRVGALLGLVCAPIAALLAFGMERNVGLGLVVAVSLFAAITLAALNGSLVPVVFQRLGVDPAVAAGPMVTTSSDLIGIAIYFGTAAVLIDWLR